VRILAAGGEGSGKSLLVLSAAKLGGLAVADPEFGMHNYLMPHPNGEAKRFTLIPRVKALLGIDAATDPLIAWIQSNDLSQIRSFMEAASKDPAFPTLAIDSASILWDIASSAVKGGEDRGEWNRVKQPLRMLQYLVLSSRKHYIFTAHMNKAFNQDMTQVIGELPWSEKKDPHWGDLNIKMMMTAEGPKAMVLKERSAGLLKKGDFITKPSLEKILKIWQAGDMIGTPLEPNEAAYRVDVAGRKAEAPK
jgi:hypothetical protein